MPSTTNKIEPIHYYTKLLKISALAENTHRTVRYISAVHSQATIEKGLLFEYKSWIL